MKADQKTDALYAGFRGRFGRRDASANGYRYEGYFRGEQAVVHDLISTDAEIVLDVCCGSGLMLLPLAEAGRFVFGVDFNADACRAASSNGFVVVRGDAFCLPLADHTVDEVVNCQFFNQQTNEAVSAFIAEASRILRSHGRIILIWRNDRAWIHRVAHSVLTAIDRIRRMPIFPQFAHEIRDVEKELLRAGFRIERREVSCAPLGWRSRATDSLRARLIGASYVLVASKSG